MKATVSIELYTLFVNRFEELYSEGIRKIMDFFLFLFDFFLAESSMSGSLVNKSSVVGKLRIPPNTVSVYLIGGQRMKSSHGSRFVIGCFRCNLIFLSKL
jgi:hypothetical protein